MNRFEQAQIILVRQLKMHDDPKLAANPPLNYRLFQDCTTAQLLDPAFAGEMVKFCYLEVGCQIAAAKLPSQPTSLIAYIVSPISFVIQSHFQTMYFAPIAMSSKRGVPVISSFAHFLAAWCSLWLKLSDVMDSMLSTMPLQWVQIQGGEIVKICCLIVDYGLRFRVSILAKRDIQNQTESQGLLSRREG